MKFTAHAVRAAAITSILGASFMAACGGDDSGAAGGSGGTGATSDASSDARGGMSGAGGTGGTSGTTGGGGTAGMLDAGPVSDGPLESDTAEEPPPPFMTQILYDFVPIDAGGNVLGWAATPANTGSSVGIASDDQAIASPTVGALEFRGVFPPPDVNGLRFMSAEVNFGDPTSGVRDFTGASAFHFWVRVIGPPGALMAFQPFVQAGSSYAYAGTYQPFVTTIDNAWHEYQVPVAGQFYLNAVWKLGIQFFAPTPPMSDASVGEGGIGESGSAGELDATIADGAAPAVDAGLSNDADAAATTDAISNDASTDASAATGQDAGGPDAAAELGDAGNPVIVHIDYVWVN